MHVREVTANVQVLVRRRWKQDKSLVPLKENVQVIVKVVVQPRAPLLGTATDPQVALLQHQIAQKPRMQRKVFAQLVRGNGSTGSRPGPSSVAADAASSASASYCVVR